MDTNIFEIRGFVIRSGRVTCNSCSPSSVYGVPTHERGCPDAREHDCHYCGITPVHRRGQVCDDCQDEE